MKVKCINNKEHDDLITNKIIYQVPIYNESVLTINKIYEVIEKYDNTHYIIMNEFGFIDLYPIKWFRPLLEIRNEKIDKLLGNESNLCEHR